MSLAPRPVLILGTRSLAIEIADFASEIPGIEIAGFVENQDRDRCKGSLEGLPIHWIDDLANMCRTHRVVCGLATTLRDAFVKQASAHGIEFATLLHPSARISKTAAIGNGSIVGPGSIVAAHARLGAHVFLNRGVLIGHHTQIGDFSTLQPGANIAGCCRIAEHVYIGIGAVVIDHVSIGDRAFVSAGSLVTKPVAARTQVFGVPAKVVRRNIAGK